MAKISIEVETNPKTLKLMVDGVEIDNISHIWINQLINRDNEVVDLECSISTTEFDKSNKVVKSTTFSTTATAEAKRALGNKTDIKDDRFPEFIGYRTTVKDDISAFLT